MCESSFLLPPMTCWQQDLSKKKFQNWKCF